MTSPPFWKPSPCEKFFCTLPLCTFLEILFEPYQGEVRGNYGADEDLEHNALRQSNSLKQMYSASYAISMAALSCNRKIKSLASSN